MQAGEEILTISERESWWASTDEHLKQTNRVEVAAAFVLIMAVLSWIEFGGPAILDNDGYYHIRWAEMLKEAAPGLPAFEALPLTSLNKHDYADHHYLFHVLLIPFTVFDLRVGAKLAAAFFASLGLVALFSLLVMHRVRYRWLWLAPMVAGSEPFLYRMSMTRAPSLSIAMLAVGTYLILKRKLWLLAALSFAFVWLYSLFPLIIAFAVAHLIAVYIAQRKVDLWPALTSCTGTILGMVVNPYFPNNALLFWKHLWMKLTTDYPVSVGVEWYPYDTWAVLAGSGLAFVIYIVALVAFRFHSDSSKDIMPLFYLIVSLLFLVMTFKSRRFIEYWPPFAVTFAAFTIGMSGRKTLFNGPARTRDRWISAVVAATVVTVSIMVMGTVLMRARENVRREADPFAYQGASEWLAANTPLGTRIFNTDWDDFPMLFYYNPHHTYIVGLDPTYLFEENQELWNLYARITLGEERNPGPLIRDRFGAEYVFTDNQHSAFLKNATESGGFETLYADRYTRVLRVLTDTGTGSADGVGSIK